VTDYTLKNKKGIKLSEDQNEIVEALLNNDFYFNCAQTGFGKTITTITAAIHKAVRRKAEDIHFILLIPSSAEKAFRDTITNILGLPVSFYTAKKRRIMNNARFHIFNYSSITSGIMTKDNPRNTNDYIEAVKELKREHPNLWLIADEAHALQDPETKQYKVVEVMMKLFIGAWGLTATPILNNLDGLFYMSNLFKPGYLAKNIYSFRNKFCTFSETFFWITRGGKKKKKVVKEVNGYKNLDILSDRFSKISIIKSKHYDIDFIYKEAKLSKETRQYYAYASAGLFSGTIDKVTGKTKKSKQNHNAARLHDLQRVVSNSHPNFQQLKDPNKITEKEYLLFQTIKEVIANNEAVLIYFTYIPTLERIKYILNKVSGSLGIPKIHEISGSVDLESRKKVESALGPKDVVLITSAGTESINLQRANNLIFYETPFPLREFVQACGRITRTNSTFDKFKVYILEAVGTIDSYKKARILNHMVIIKKLLGSSNTLPVEVLILSEEDKKAMKEDLLWKK
jgi:superfamily II DNA or RNA helicase